MSRFEYFLAFETILYGLVLAHIVMGFSKMIYHRKTIRFYWGHVLACIAVFFVVIQTYYSLFWVPDDTVINTWTFFFLRILPLTLLYIMVYQIIPEDVEGLEAEPFLFQRLKEVLIPMTIFNLLTVVKTIYYRWDQYLEWGDGVLYASHQFLLYVVPFLCISAFTIFLTFNPHLKRTIEGFIIFIFLVAMAMMTIAPTSR